MNYIGEAFYCTVCKRNRDVFPLTRGNCSGLFSRAPFFDTLSSVMPNATLFVVPYDPEGMAMYFPVGQYINT